MSTPDHFKDFIQDNRTALAVMRVKNSSLYSPPQPGAPNGFYAGRRIIGRGTSISGGVYLGGGSREVIMVDESVAEDKAILDNIYQDLLKRREVAGKSFKEGIIQTVFEVVKTYLPYDSRKTSMISRSVGQDGLISLCRFIEQRAGVCRHQALLAAYLLERLVREGKLSGKASAERNSVLGFVHAWARYESSKGTVFIIDPAQGYAGPLDQVSGKQWRYDDVRRPEDLEMGAGVYELSPNMDPRRVMPPPEINPPVEPRIEPHPPAEPRIAPQPPAELREARYVEGYVAAPGVAKGPRYSIDMERKKSYRFKLKPEGQIVLVLARQSSPEVFVTIKMGIDGKIRATYLHKNGLQ